MKIIKKKNIILGFTFFFVLIFKYIYEQKSEAVHLIKNNNIFEVRKGDIHLINKTGEQKSLNQILIYGDFACPSCVYSFQEIAKQSEKIQKLIQSNKLEIIYRPTPMSWRSLDLWLIPICDNYKDLSNQEKFKIIEILYKNSNSLYEKNYLDIFKKGLETANISMTNFEKCISSQDNKNNIIKKTEEAIKDKIKFTPSIFLNKKLIKTEDVIDFLIKD